GRCRAGPLRRRLVEPFSEQAVRVGRAQALRHPVVDEPELFDLIAAVQPVTAGVPVRDHEPVPVLPGAGRGHRDAEHPGHGADAEDGTGRSCTARIRAFHPRLTLTVGRILPYSSSTPLHVTLKTSSLVGLAGSSLFMCSSRTPR